VVNFVGKGFEVNWLEPTDMIWCEDWKIICGIGSEHGFHLFATCVTAKTLKIINNHILVASECEMKFYSRDRVMVMDTFFVFHNLVKCDDESHECFLKDYMPLTRFKTWRDGFEYYYYYYRKSRYLSEQNTCCFLQCQSFSNIHFRSHFPLHHSSILVPIYNWNASISIKYLTTIAEKVVNLTDNLFHFLLIFHRLFGISQMVSHHHPPFIPSSVSYKTDMNFLLNSVNLSIHPFTLLLVIFSIRLVLIYPYNSDEQFHLFSFNFKKMLFFPVLLCLF